MSDACGGEFKISEIQVLYNLALEILPSDKFSDDIQLYHFFKNKYDEMVMQSQRTKINKRFGYLKKLFEVELTQ